MIVLELPNHGILLIILLLVDIFIFIQSLHVCFLKFIHFFSIIDDNDDEDSLQALGELEKIDDDCDKHGIQFVKIDDEEAAKAFGIDDVPALVYFEKQIPNVYDGKCSSSD